jgi:hypothetical protein
MSSSVSLQQALALHDTQSSVLKLAVHDTQSSVQDEDLDQSIMRSMQDLRDAEQIHNRILMQLHRYLRIINNKK